jgi:hypothetical protein
VVAPTNATLLTVTANTTSFENGLALASGGTAQASAHLSIFVQEFSPTGAFVRNVVGPSTVVFDASAFFFGFHIRVDETNARTASILMPVVGNGRYRIWVDSLQFVNVAGAAHAASNFVYDFGPLFFVFS